jgi:hypothetical protein
MSMPMFAYNTWIDENTYMEELAKLHKLNPKLDIIDVLKREFDKLQSDVDYRSDLPGEGREWLLTELSGQIVALALELSDDLAAVCSSYLDTIENGDRLYIERLANWELGRGHSFYELVAGSTNESARAVGLNDVSTHEEQEAVRQRFAFIKDMRVRFWQWYTGYKHGQRATPIALIVRETSRPETKEWGLYLIPKTFRRDSGKIHTEDRFINTVGNIALFYRLAVECVALSTETRDRQYAKVFGCSLT